MDLRKQFATSAQKEQDGVWTDDLGGGLQLKIARLRNPQFRSLYKRLSAPYERQIRQKTLDEKIEEGIINKCLAETVLLDWKNLELDGKVLHYTKETALRIFSDPTLQDFRDLIVELASNAELFREQSLEEAEKNLQAGLHGM